MKLVVIRGRQTETGRLCWPRRAVATQDFESRQVALMYTLLGQPEMWTVLTRPGDRKFTPQGLGPRELVQAWEAGPLALGRRSDRRHFTKTGRRQTSRRMWHRKPVPGRTYRLLLSCSGRGFTLLGLGQSYAVDILFSRV